LQRENRRLAAIVAADIAGYSRLIGQDEEGTLRALRARRAELIDPLIEQHGGRIANTAGDSLLLEFPSAVDAVRCAIAVQESMAERNSDFEPDKQIRFRVGINVGDVVVQGDDLLGDGVNVAARLEGICEPGGIMLSDDAYRHIRGRIDSEFRDQGQQQLKNITEPVQAHMWLLKARVGQVADDILESVPLSDKPSFAVLPFDNMSGDPEQEYFADGIAEDIISTLSQLPWFFVVSRNSSFSFKGQTKDIPQMARQLGVQYILEGSVRKAGNRVRVTAPLIDARNDRHIWADRFDRELTDIFAVQDEITEKIVAAVSPEFMAAEMNRAWTKPTQNLDAWDLLMQAHWHLNQFNRESNLKAQELLKQVVRLEPNNDLALGDLATSHSLGLTWGWYDDPDESKKLAASAAQKAAELNERNVAAWFTLGRMDIDAGRYDDAISKGRKAVELAPNSGESHGYLGTYLMYNGDCEEAITELELAIRLSPRDPRNAMFYAPMSVVLFLSGRYEESISWCKKAFEDLANPLPGVHRPMVASYAMLERMNEARGALESLQSRVPNVSIEATRQQMPFRREADMDHYLDALRKAGLAEE